MSRPICQFAYLVSKDAGERSTARSGYCYRNRGDIWPSWDRELPMASLSADCSTNRLLLLSWAPRLCTGHRVQLWPSLPPWLLREYSHYTGGRFTTTYDAAQRITRVLNPEGDRTSYAYDAASRRTLKKLANGTRASFAYDNANQLTGENRTGASPYRNTFTFDSRGNRTVNNAGGTRTTTIYDAANQMIYSQTGAPRTTYVFDCNGNQQVVKNSDGTRTTTTWDYENQPTLYKLSTGSRVTMAYNADNQRTRKDS